VPDLQSVEYLCDDDDDSSWNEDGGKDDDQDSDESSFNFTSNEKGSDSQ